MVVKWSFLNVSIHESHDQAVLTGYMCLQIMFFGFMTQDFRGYGSLDLGMSFMTI